VPPDLSFSIFCLGEGAYEMADTTTSSTLPPRLALPLVATLSIASWVAVIGVIYLERLAISYLTGI
jgi:hypothetical protein